MKQNLSYVTHTYTCINHNLVENIMKKTIALIAIILLPLFLTRCAAIVAGGAAAGGTIWYKGELKDVMSGTVPQIHKAAIQAVKNLKFEIKNENSDELRGEIEAEMSDGTKIKISSRSKDKNITEIRVRVGIMGDKQVSQRIVDETRNNLTSGKK